MCKQIYSPDYVHILWVYNRVAKELLKTYKYKRVEDVSSVIKSDLTLYLTERNLLAEDYRNTIFIPVPLYTGRSNERGFNQVDKIGDFISERLSGRYKSDFLVRIRSTERQSHVKKEERSLNVGGAFILNRKYIGLIKRTSKIVIVDDVLTTGSTIEEICKKLIEQKPDLVIEVIALFRGKYRPSLESK